LAIAVVPGSDTSQIQSLIHRGLRRSQMEVLVGIGARP
jgi:hypothetical protein